MRINIHRGTHQIGGSITEISTTTTRIFIDLGSELPDADGMVQPEGLSIDGVTEGLPKCDAVLFTHYHGDHIGRLSEILSGIPVYMGSAAKDIYLALQRRVRDGIPEVVEPVRCLSQRQKIWINDIAVTPFSVDHSAYDAYMFLIEAEGKRILHTGDFRSHGFRGKGLLPTLEKYVGQVDVLIIEGTVLSRDESDHLTEQELQIQARQLLFDYKYVFVICSSTHIDRIGAFYQATPKGKYFIGDQYQKEILAVVEKYAGHYSKLYQFGKLLTYGVNLHDKLEAKGFCMLARSGSSFQWIMDYYRTTHNEEVLIIYSMWEGYLKQPASRFNSMLEGFENCVHLHSSGHADVKTILDVCRAVSPSQAIIPIHSTNSRRLSSLGLPYNIEYLDDGQSYEL
jgi:ribonuclease J